MKPVIKEKELFYLLALQKSKRIGAITAKKLIAHSGSAEAVFLRTKKDLQSIDGIGSHTIEFIQDKETLQKAEKELNYIQRYNIQYTSFLSENYPEKLKHCIDSPLLLFYDGTIKIDKRPIISIVGTRNMTSYGRDFVHKLITDIKPYNPIIVSGYAYGVDITAHKAAIKNGLQTLAVLANGIDKIYPAAHKKYMYQVLENGGFLTEHWHDDEPLREHFLQRNRIVAGISEATIIVESAAKGGSLVTAGLANSYNRDVFAVPGRITDTYSQGCNNLIRTNRAALLNSAEDLVYLLNWDNKQTQQKVIQPKLFINLEGEEKIVYDFLVDNGKSLLDVIALECSIPIYKLSGILMNLELQGIIRPLPGKLFEII